MMLVTELRKSEKRVGLGNKQESDLGLVQIKFQWNST